MNLLSRKWKRPWFYTLMGLAKRYVGLRVWRAYGAHSSCRTRCGACITGKIRSHKIPRQTQSTPWHARRAMRSILGRRNVLFGYMRKSTEMPSVLDNAQNRQCRSMSTPPWYRMKSIGAAYRSLTEQEEQWSARFSRLSTPTNGNQLWTGMLG